MSRTAQGIATFTLVLALTQLPVFAQSYTWRNVQIFGGGFIVWSPAALAFSSRPAAARHGGDGQ